MFYLYLIIRSTTHNPCMLVICYTEVSTLLIQEVAPAPTNWIGIIIIPPGVPLHKGEAQQREVERDL